MPLLPMRGFKLRSTFWLPTGIPAIPAVGMHLLKFHMPVISQNYLSP